MLARARAAACQCQWQAPSHAVSLTGDWQAQPEARHWQADGRAQCQPSRDQLARTGPGPGPAVDGPGSLSWFKYY